MPQQIAKGRRENAQPLNVFGIHYKYFIYLIKIHSYYITKLFPNSTLWMTCRNSVQYFFNSLCCFYLLLILSNSMSNCRGAFCGIVSRVKESSTTKDRILYADKDEYMWLGVRYFAFLCNGSTPILQSGTLFSTNDGTLFLTIELDVVVNVQTICFQHRQQT
jgi:hypothetical protein